MPRAIEGAWTTDGTYGKAILADMGLVIDSLAAVPHRLLERQKPSDSDAAPNPPASPLNEEVADVMTTRPDFVRPCEMARAFSRQSESQRLACSPGTDSRSSTRRSGNLEAASAGIVRVVVAGMVPFVDLTTLKVSSRVPIA